ncbi:MAG: hypothetical protein ABSA57_11055 [Candidatus Acidiferrales bacterium]|jgi:hypothetical protein
MTLQHVNVKLLVKNPAEADLEPLIPIFHGWIQEQVFEELLLDVADYRHVPAGPGVMLIGLQADYSVDNTDDRLGVRYNRKAGADGSNQDRLRQAAHAALRSFQRLEADPRLGGKLRFDGQELEVFINDRILAPNNAETRQAADSEFQAFAKRLFQGTDYSLSYNNEPRRLLGASIRASRAFSVSQLLNNLS